MKIVMRRLCATGAAAGMMLALQSRDAPFVGSLGVAAVLSSLLLFGLLTWAARGPRAHSVIIASHDGWRGGHEKCGDAGGRRR